MRYIILSLLGYGERESRWLIYVEHLEVGSLRFCNRSACSSVMNRMSLHRWLFVCLGRAWDLPLDVPVLGLSFAKARWAGVS